MTPQTRDSRRGQLASPPPLAAGAPLPVGATRTSRAPFSGPREERGSRRAWEVERISRDRVFCAGTLLRTEPPMFGQATCGALRHWVERRVARVCRSNVGWRPDATIAMGRAIRMSKTFAPPAGAIAGVVPAAPIFAKRAHQARLPSRGSFGPNSGGQRQSRTSTVVRMGERSGPSGRAPPESAPIHGTSMRRRSVQPPPPGPRTKTTMGKSALQCWRHPPRGGNESVNPTNRPYDGTSVPGAPKSWLLYAMGPIARKRKVSLGQWTTREATLNMHSVRYDRPPPGNREKSRMPFHRKTLHPMLWSNPLESRHFPNGDPNGGTRLRRPSIEAQSPRASAARVKNEGTNPFFFVLSRSCTEFPFQTAEATRLIESSRVRRRNPGNHELVPKRKSCLRRET